MEYHENECRYGFRVFREVHVGEDQVLRRMKRQHGLVTRAQALDDGMTSHQIRHRLDTGRWVSVARGVYRHAAVDPNPISRLLTVCLAHEALASHRSAAALHGIDGYRLGRAEVVVSSGTGLVLSGVTVHESTQMDLAGPIERQGVLCTGLARTVLDLAAVLSSKQLGRTVDAVLRDRRLRLSDLYRVLDSHARRGRPGCTALRAALDDRLGEDLVPLSEWSRMVEDLLVGFGLDRPRVEYRICRSDGSLIAQVDLAYPQRRVAIELDSVRWHHNRRSFVEDRRRRNRIMLAGWDVLNFTWDDYRDRPTDLCTQVAAACAAS